MDMQTVIDVDEFLSLVDTDDWEDTENCWLWKGTRWGGEYGYFNGVYAHRIMYELVYGPILKGLNICHNCPNGDNPSCVNPYHLWAGTQKENIQDAIKKGRFNNEWQRKRSSEIHKGNRYCLGRHHTEEAKKKMSEAQKGVPKSEEHKRKVGLSKIGNSYWLGRHHTEEARIKIGKANSRRVWSEESRAKLSTSNKGKHRSDETRRRMSIASKGRVPPNKGKHLSEETKQKFREARIHLSDDARKKMSEAAKHMWAIRKGAIV